MSAIPRVEIGTGDGRDLWMETCRYNPELTDREYRGMICLDLDGTLIHGGSPVAESTETSMARLGRHGWLRVIATGRSLISLQRVIPDPARFPADYVVFSSGAGILGCEDNRIIRAINHTPSALTPVLSVLNRMHLDYMIHHPAPHNAPFSWWSSGADNPDFFRRIDLYQSVCSPLPEPPDNWLDLSAQVIAVVPEQSAERQYYEVCESLGRYSIIRTTSPLDGVSVWIEIMPLIVTKGQTCDWLKHRLFRDPVRTIAIGNDTNDRDLLQWADEGYLVPDAPPDLKNCFHVLPGNGPDPLGPFLDSLTL